MTVQPKKYEDLTFSDDFLFCKILMNNESITKELIELILKVKVRKVVVEKQKAIELTADGKGIRVRKK